MITCELNFEIQQIRKTKEVDWNFIYTGPCIVNRIFVKAGNIRYNQSRILKYTLVLIAPYFTHCSQSIPEAVITAVPAPDDGCQHPKHVELPTEM